MSQRREIRKLLIANRGEIAVRIARAAHDLGIATVAVASEADREALHTRIAGEVVEIGPAPAAQSYLDPEALIEAARDRGCDAIHPGYGFLAQNPEFAERVEAAGFVFVGPSGAAIRLMGDKTAARKSMRAAGVPVVPGFEGSGGESDEVLLRAAEGIGLPLMVKAAAGGGGRGMRVVVEPELTRERERVEDTRAAVRRALPEALASARREAEKAFGDGRLFLERYVEDARHVEVQVLADAYGGCVHLFERECSIQRRHQKIVEESPSPLLDAKLRARMGEAALAAARVCGYRNAGTVEFLVGEDRSFYFLEMNTRIQVEHPVTECVTGIDLVEAQLRVAAGEPLWLRQEELTQRGHAIECRLNAEDPRAGFLPSSGEVLLARYPAGPGVRVDSGYEAGDRVSTHYDNLLAKVIVHAADRPGAIRRMERALAGTVVLGVATNLAYLEAVLAHPVFRKGEATTSFVERLLPRLPDLPASLPEEALIVAALADAVEIARAGGNGAALPAGPTDADIHSPWARADGWRPGAS